MLEDNRTIGSYGISNGTTIFASMRISGGSDNNRNDSRLRKIDDGRNYTETEDSDEFDQPQPLQTPPRTRTPTGDVQRGNCQLLRDAIDNLLPQPHTHGWLQSVRAIHANDPDKFSYVYLVIEEPRSLTVTFKHFIEAILYVGKGTGNRNMDHLFAAKNGVVGGSSPFLVIRIQEAWDRGQSRRVTPYRSIENLSSQEAYCHEHIIIETLGRENISNQDYGRVCGSCVRIALNLKQEAGLSILMEAYQNFLQNNNIMWYLRHDIP